MPRPFNKVPTYKLHSSTGNARCWVGGKWVTLGKYNSPESRAEFARIVAELAASPAPVLPVVGISPATASTVDELLLAFLAHAGKHYRTPDGEQTDEVREIKRSVLYVHKLYGSTPAASFGPKALEVVRNEMIRADWCRTLINRRIERVKRAFRWAASKELVGIATYTALCTLDGLEEGRSDARESEPVAPVPVEHVTATLPYLAPHPRVMVQLQLLTGMRPGEVCRLRMEHVETDGPFWVYSPRQHKTRHRGKARTIVIGPQARALLEGFFGARLLADPGARLFSPAASQAMRREAQRAARKSKVPPSQMDRRAEQPKKGPGQKYTADSLGYAVRKAAEKAKVPAWAPNQLRHTYGTMVRKRFGLEAAQVMLGHARADVTQVYAERNIELAQQVAREVG